jgi:hypothetical protein
VYGDIDLVDADAKMTGEPNGYSGNALAAGDLNGDGVTDYVVGSPWTDLGSGVDNGTVYVAYGPISGVVDLASADARVDGMDDDYLGAETAVMDVDRDGIQDLVVGAPGADEVYVFFGPVVGGYEPADADAVLVGAVGESLGARVSALPDIDGDGFDDLMVAGDVSYLILGSFVGTVNVSSIAGVTFEATGASVAGDVDGDGWMDVLFGDGYASITGVATAGTGELQLGPFAGHVATDAAEARFLGERGEGHLGLSLSMGDLDGDGRSDLVMGQPELYSFFIPPAGSAHVTFGSSF